MATRSIIGGVCNDNKVRAVYVHFDGYGHLKYLEKICRTTNDVTAFLEIGDRSGICDEKGYEDGLGYRFEGDSIEALKKWMLEGSEWDSEYLYIWTGEKWERYEFRFDYKAEAECRKTNNILIENYENQ